MFELKLSGIQKLLHEDFIMNIQIFNYNIYKCGHLDKEKLKNDANVQIL